MHYCPQIPYHTLVSTELLYSFNTGKRRSSKSHKIQHPPDSVIFCMVEKRAVGQKENQVTEPIVSWNSGTHPVGLAARGPMDP